MGPLLFEPYAKVLAERAALLQPDCILETAAGVLIAPSTPLRQHSSGGTETTRQCQPTSSQRSNETGEARRATELSNGRLSETCIHISDGCGPTIDDKVRIRIDLRHGELHAAATSQLRIPPLTPSYDCPLFSITYRRWLFRHRTGLPLD